MTTKGGSMTHHDGDHEYVDYLVLICTVVFTVGVGSGILLAALVDFLVSL